MTAITCTSASKAMTAVAEIRRRLAKATDLGKIKDLHDRAVELLSRKGTSALDRDVSYQAAELKLVAERKMGLILAALHLRGGDRRSAVAARKLTLDRLRISRRQSAAWQLEGLLPDEDFAAYIQQAARDGKQPSSHGLCCLARRYVESTAFAGNSPECFGRVAGGLRTLARQGRQFACILIDSPGAAASKGRASAFRIDPRLAHLPLLEVAAPQAHIYLRATPESREECQASQGLGTRLEGHAGLHGGSARSSRALAAGPRTVAFGRSRCAGTR